MCPKAAELSPRNFPDLDNNKNSHRLSAIDLPQQKLNQSFNLNVHNHKRTADALASSGSQVTTSESATGTLVQQMPPPARDQSVKVKRADALPDKKKRNCEDYPIT